MTAPSPFIEGTKLQYAWDSTSLGYLKECPRKYELSILEGWRSKESSHHLIFGGHFATAVERYEKWKAEFNLSHDDAVILVTWALLQDTYGWESFDKHKNRDNLLRSVIWYFEEYKDDPAKVVRLANGKPAVELSFKFDVDYTAYDQQFLLCGHLDRLVDFDGTLYVMDEKTTGSTLGPYYFDQYNPDNQMTLYTLASQVVYNMPVKGVIIDAAQIAVGFTAFARGITVRSSGQLEEWLDDLQIWFDLAAHYAASNHWPMNEKSCNNYGKCTFHDICNKDKAVRQQFLETRFERRQWNPLENR